MMSTDTAKLERHYKKMNQLKEHEEERGEIYRGKNRSSQGEEKELCFVNLMVNTEQLKKRCEEMGK